MSEPLFQLSSMDPRRSLRQEGAMYRGIDISAETALLDRDDLASSLWEEVREKSKNIQRWLSDNHLDDVLRTRMGQRMSEAMSKSILTVLEGMIQSLAEGKTPSSSSFLATQDPISLCVWLSNTMQEVDSNLNAFMTMCGMLSAFDPSAVAERREVVISLLKLRALIATIYYQQSLRMLDRVIHGVPEWDCTTGTELPLVDFEFPPFDALTPAERQVEQEIEQQQVNDLFSRLTHGIQLPS